MSSSTLKRQLCFQHLLPSYYGRIAGVHLNGITEFFCMTRREIDYVKKIHDKNQQFHIDAWWKKVRQSRSQVKKKKKWLRICCHIWWSPCCDVFFSVPSAGYPIFPKIECSSTPPKSSSVTHYSWHCNEKSFLYTRQGSNPVLSHKLGKKFSSELSRFSSPLYDRCLARPQTELLLMRHREFHPALCTTPEVCYYTLFMDLMIVSARD